MVYITWITRTGQGTQFELFTSYDEAIKYANHLMLLEDPSSKPVWTETDGQYLIYTPYIMVKVYRKFIDTRKVD